ncbi:MAG: hypothetical protein V4463_24075 [Pseudomonadota bacterium]
MKRTTMYKTAFVALLLPALLRAEVLEEQVAKVGGGSNLSQSVSTGSGVELQAGKGSDDITLKLSRNLSWLRLGDADHAAGRSTTASLIVSAPLDKKEKLSDLLTLDGLAATSSIAFAFNSFTADIIRVPVSARDLAALDAICLRILAAKNPKAAKEAEGKPFDGCDSGYVAANGTKQDADEFDRYFWRGDTHKPMWMWGVNGKVAFPSYEYVDAAKLAKDKRKETPWSVGAYASAVPRDTKAIVTLDLKYQRAFEEGDDTILCPVGAAGAGSVTCVSGALGQPRSITKKLLAVDLRRDFGAVGVGFTLTHDFARKDTTVELPVYFIKDGDGKLNAGVKFAYRSEKKQYGASIFVGSSLGIF